MQAKLLIGLTLLGVGCAPDVADSSSEHSYTAGRGLPAAGAGLAGTAGASTLPLQAAAGGGAGVNVGAAGAGPNGLPAAGSGGTTSSSGSAGMRAAAGTPAAVGGAAGAPAPTSTADCAAPPADAPAGAVAALNAVNKLRVAAGATCATLNTQIVQAATAHCNYYETNNKTTPMCTSNPHMEVTGCTGFTGASPIDRMRAAGFMSNGGGEVMAFVNNPERAVQTWVDSVWHRIPILDPSTNLLGYGSSASCDTIDFGPGTRPAAATVLVYPYDGQTGVTTSFNGQYEGPMPPAPTTGWPSSNPITLYAQKPVITEHVLTVDGTTEPIEHVWLDSTSTLLSASDQQFLRSSVFMYANKPFAANTKYRVKIAGTYAGGALAKEWTFTTGAASTRGNR